MDKLARQALLYDFYGELLTEHQQNVYEDVVLNDYSLSEVAQDQGISRQGVHDLVKRSTRIPEEYEEKLHLVEKFVAVREKIHEIHGLTQHYEEKDLNQVMNRIETLSHSILEEIIACRPCVIWPSTVKHSSGHRHFIHAVLRSK